MSGIQTSPKDLTTPIVVETEPYKASDQNARKHKTSPRDLTTPIAVDIEPYKASDHNVRNTKSKGPHYTKENVSPRSPY